MISWQWVMYDLLWMILERLVWTSCHRTNFNEQYNELGLAWYRRTTCFQGSYKNDSFLYVIQSFLLTFHHLFNDIVSHCKALQLPVLFCTNIQIGTLHCVRLSSTSSSSSNWMNRFIIVIIIKFINAEILDNSHVNLYKNKIAENKPTKT